MHVVRHEAVRIYLNAPIGARSQKRPSDVIRECRRREIPAPLESAHRHEDAMKTEIEFVAELRRTPMGHGGDDGKA